MKKTIEVEIDEDKYKKFQLIISKVGKNVNQVFDTLIDNTIRDNDIDWLFTSVKGEVKAKGIKMKKAIQLFKEIGYSVLSSYNTTFASKNKGNDVYWLNPDIRHLFEDWYIILNDYKNKILYLLFIPANSISALAMRNDKICNVSISYENLIDKLSNTNFKKYLINFIKYDTLLD